MRKPWYKRIQKQAAVPLKKSAVQQKQHIPIPLTESLSENIDHIKKVLNNPGDLLIRNFVVGPNQHPCAIVCIDGLVEKAVINDQILRNLLHLSETIKQSDPALSSPDSLLSFIRSEALPVNELKAIQGLDELLFEILAGETALLVDGCAQALIGGTRGWKSRQVGEPTSEQVVRGPKESFTEDIRTNTALIRRRIRDPNLRFDTYLIGRRSRKEVVCAYIEGIAHPALVEEVKRRLSSIDIDDIEGSGPIEHWISDSAMSPFPQILSTERPDRVSSSLLQGRIAVIVDGTPFQIVMPLTLAAAFQSPEDYYQNWLIATLIRLLRLTAAFFATFLPALYIALVEYHHGMIPSKLAFSIAGSREGVPFPAVVEALMMEATLELLREAGIRLPKPIGQTIGIVGGLVIGEAAVQAGIVSPIMVIVVAITAISSFALPSYSFAVSLRIIRFGIMISTAVFGLYGLVMVYIMINIHIVNLRSFGIPYSAPFSPGLGNDWKDLILRAPITMMDERPRILQPVDKDRMPGSGG
ncbi:spore germination protein [Paenibacillus thermotolerans]|uniref:spore germination protein n=1 Tax=Paenibacillus thermotolerans TaxID=3027807 RepID=UPI002368CB7F|nr:MULTISPECIES: spore germination protein [unclassified Paenibacillus]